MTDPQKFALSAAQIQGLDTVDEDRRAIERTLGTAMNFYANRTVEINRRRREWWIELGEHFGFEPQDGYSVEQVDGEMCIVPEKSTPRELHLNQLLGAAASELIKSCSKATEAAAHYAFADSVDREHDADTSGREPPERDTNCTAS